MPIQPDEEILRWHGKVVIAKDARPVIEGLAEMEKMTFDEVVEEIQRKRYWHRQIWSTTIGDEPHEKLPDWLGDSLTTNMNLPTGMISLTTYMSPFANPYKYQASEIKLRSLHQSPRPGPGSLSGLRRLGQLVIVS